MMENSRRLLQVRARIKRAASRATRKPSDVQLIAITKTRPIEEVEMIIKAGVRDVGENKVQEADIKKKVIEFPARWHLVGHLQKNKVKKAVSLFDVIHSVDSISLGRRVNSAAEELGKQQAILVQVDLANEATKFGIPVNQLFETLDHFKTCVHLSTQGLMILPPYLDDLEKLRPYFARLRELRDQALNRGLLSGVELSMGMSHDFEIAVEEGATMIRLGTSLFGPRITEE